MSRALGRAAVITLLFLGLVAPTAAADDPYELSRLEASREEHPATEEAIAAGKVIYLKHCAFCHGDDGSGNGGAAPYLDPRPRDFSQGLFKFRSTLTGELPLDEDLYRSISRGVPGTAMPAWGDAPFTLTEAQRWQVAYYVKELSSEDFGNPDFDPYEYKVDLPPVPQVTLERQAAGEELYSDEKKGGCIKCHGVAGRGDGQEAGTHRDDWGGSILPADLSKRRLYKNGDTAAEIFRTFSTGLNGTPMPGYAETLSEDERWDLAFYVESLQEDITPESEIVLVARRHEGKLPVDPTDAFWEEPAPLDVPLGGQVIVSPRHTSPTIDLVRVRAAYNLQEVAFHFTWNDRFENTSAPPMGNGGPGGSRWLPELADPGAFVAVREIWERRGTELPDRLQIQFPVEIVDGPAKPFFFMGDRSHPVNLWIWQGDWNQDPARSGRTASEGNAAGYSEAPELQDPESETLVGRAHFEAGRWRLVLKRPLTTPDTDLDAQFTSGVLIPFALQAWDGGNGEEGLLCAVSSWYYVQLEGRVDPKGYLWAILGMLATVGGGRLAVSKAKKQWRHSES